MYDIIYYNIILIGSIPILIFGLILITLVIIYMIFYIFNKKLEWWKWYIIQDDIYTKLAMLGITSMFLFIPYINILLTIFIYKLFIEIIISRRK